MSRAQEFKRLDMLRRFETSCDQAEQLCNLGGQREMNPIEANFYSNEMFAVETMGPKRPTMPTECHGTDGQKLLFTYFPDEEKSSKREPQRMGTQREPLDDVAILELVGGDRSLVCDTAILEHGVDAGFSALMKTGRDGTTGEQGPTEAIPPPNLTVVGRSGETSDW